MSTPLAVGQRLAGRYELLDTVATGGMAQVWRARDAVLGREVAVKVLHPHLSTDRGFLLRFRREAVAAARLSHPSIVSIYDTVSENGTEAIVMELIQGRTLRDSLNDGGPLSEAEVAYLGTQIADALTEAHRAGVVHRDIKPSNIMLCPEHEHNTSRHRVLVTDFGIAKAGEDTDLTVTGTLLGTAKYLAPEQVTGDPVDPRSDLYALGVVLFEALTGKAPFQADTDVATALARLHQAPPHARSIRPNLSAELDSIIHRLMSRAPQSRYQSAVEVRAALSALPKHQLPIADQTLVVAEQPAHRIGSSPQPSETSNPDSYGADSYGADSYGADSYGAPASSAPYAEQPDDLDEPADGFMRSERSWMLPALALLLTAVALVVAVRLFAESPLLSKPQDQDTTSPDSLDPDSLELDNQGEVSATTLLGIVEVVEPRIASAATLDFDALGGDGDENGALVANAFDGDDDTNWRTDTYKRPHFGALKPGVGLLVDLGGNARLSSVSLETNSEGWTVEFYLGSTFGPNPADWGPPAATIVDGSGSEDVDLAGTGQFLLIWITDHGLSDDGIDEDELPDNRFELAELSIE